MTKEINDSYEGKLNIPIHLNKNDVVEYRVVAEDNSSRKNKKYSPSNGYYSLAVVENYEPVTAYSSDFDSYSNDFAFSDFEISTPLGFSTGALHSITPYTESQIAGEKQNLIAQLKYPMILENNGQMSFDEIVLVEPGEQGSIYTDDNFWDYVIVEASKNFGKTWEPLIDGYDSGENETWEHQFTSTLKSNVSCASGQENMYWNHTIYLDGNGNFSSGDTVLIRFRLASDNTVNGWGWAIDNLRIQDNSTDPNNTLAFDNINIYPNPFSNNVYIDCNSIASDQASVEVMITDMTGKTVYRQTNFDIKYNPKLQVDLSTISPGIYLASVTDENFNTITKRIVKN